MHNYINTFIYTHVHVCIHIKSDPKHSAWAGNSVAIPGQSLEISATRLKLIMGLPNVPSVHNSSEILALRRSKYGLGDRRTLSQVRVYMHGLHIPTNIMYCIHIS